VLLQPLLSPPAAPAAPTAANLTYTTTHDTTLGTLISGGSVLSGASDPQGYPLTALLVDNVSHGTLVLLPDGEFLYQPEAGGYGADQFTYQVWNGFSDSAVATLSLQVTESVPVPDPLPKTYSLPPGMTSRVTADNGLLMGAHGCRRGFLTAVLAAAPAHGSLVVAPDGSFVYTPAAGYIGPDQISYRSATAYSTAIRST
jgi:titin